MKLRNIFFLAFIVLACNACLVKALHPFYKEEQVVFEPSFVGQWIDVDSCQWIIEQFKTDNSPLARKQLYDAYVVSYTEENGKTSKFYSTYFKLGDDFYIDFYPIIDDIYPDFQTYHISNNHSIAKVEVNTDETIEFKWFKEEWLSDLFKNRKVKIAHEVIDPVMPYMSESYIITASTDELQKFLLKYGNDPQAFECEEGLCILLKPYLSNN